MEDNVKLIESLLEKAGDLGKTSLELAKLKVLDKTSDIVSSILPEMAMYALLAAFMFFFNLGLAFWLGEVLGKTFLGFLVVAVFYAFSGLIFFLFLKKWLKTLIRNYIIKQALK